MFKKQINETPNTGSTKYEIIIEHDTVIQIWRYDTKISKNAYEVENVYKGESKFTKLKKGSK